MRRQKSLGSWQSCERGEELSRCSGYTATLQTPSETPEAPGPILDVPRRASSAKADPSRAGGTPRCRGPHSSVQQGISSLPCPIELYRKSLRKSLKLLRGQTSLQQPPAQFRTSACAAPAKQQLRKPWKPEVSPGSSSRILPWLSSQMAAVTHSFVFTTASLPDASIPAMVWLG